MTSTADFIIIGAGIAGASVAYFLAPHGRVLLLERETQPGYHSTGRSAALYMESYGSPQVRALTLASRAFLEDPPDGFTAHHILTRRGAMAVAPHGCEAQLDAHWDVVHAIDPRARRLTAAEARGVVPALRADMVAAAVFEPDAFDMDVNVLHHGFLRGMRRHGGTLVCDAEVLAMQHADGIWKVRTRAGDYTAPVVLNAAGAWADAIGALAGSAGIGLEPRRRSAFVFEPPPSVDIRAWPLVFGVEEDWYIKPDAGLLLGSPANADPVEPHDVQAEDIDIATAISRIQRMTTLQIRRPSHVWAGLRSFVHDGSLVGGWDTALPGFFWVAAQGGYGIQTCAAMGEACAAMARGEALSARIAGFGLTAAMLSPARLSA